MRGKRAAAPSVESPWAMSILPSTSTQPPTAAVAVPPSAPDAPAAPPPPPAPAPAPAPVEAALPVPSRPVQSALPAPAWSPAAAAPSQSSFVSAPHLGAGRQFAADTFGASSQFGPPAQFAPPPQYAPPAQFAPPQFAPPAQFPPPAQFGGPPQPHTYQLAPVTTGRSAAGIVVGIVGGVVLVLVLAAIAIPVFLSQRNRPANRTVIVPATLLRMPQIHSQNLDEGMAQTVAAMSPPNAPWGQVSGAYFGAGELPTFAVAAAKLNTRPTSTDEATFLSKVSPASLASVAPGPFGGKMSCGPETAEGVTATICYAIDDAGVFAIVVFESSPTQAAVLARQIIGAVEH